MPEIDRLHEFFFQNFRFPEFRKHTFELPMRLQIKPRIYFRGGPPRPHLPGHYQTYHELIFRISLTMILN